MSSGVFVWCVGPTQNGGDLTIVIGGPVLVQAGLRPARHAGARQSKGISSVCRAGQGPFTTAGEVGERGHVVQSL